MTLKQQLYEMPKGSLLYINAPMIQHIMAGTRSVTIKKSGLIRVEYQDGTFEERKAGKDLMQQEAGNITLFSLVSFVQDGRHNHDH